MKRKLGICAALLCALFGCAVHQPDDPLQASPPPEDTPPSVSQPLEEAPPSVPPPPEDTPLAVSRPSEEVLPSVSQPPEEVPPEVPSPEPLTLPVRESPVAVGYGDYYVIRSDGALVTWGRPEFGGDGEDVPFSQAKELLPNAAAVYTSGRGASLAVDRDGGLWAINMTRFGGAVLDAQGDGEPSMTPVKVMDGVAMAALDQFHSLVLMQDGTLWVDGYARFGAPWLEEKGDYWIKVMDDVIWADVTAYGAYAVTSGHELWGWGFTPKESRPEKLMTGVVQVSSSHLAVTEQGDLLGWSYDYEAGALTRPEVLLQNVAWCGRELALTRDGGLWACEQSGAWTCEQLLDEAVGADWGETAMLALRPDDSLWLLYRGEDSGVLLG